MKLIADKPQAQRQTSQCTSW